MYRAGTGFPGQKVFQAGVIDDMDVFNALGMEVEFGGMHDMEETNVLDNYLHCYSSGHTLAWC